MNKFLMMALFFACGGAVSVTGKVGSLVNIKRAGNECVNNKECRERFLGDCRKDEECKKAFFAGLGFKPEAVQDIAPEKWENMIPKGHAELEHLSDTAKQNLEIQMQEMADKAETEKERAIAEAIEKFKAETEIREQELKIQKDKIKEEYKNRVSRLKSDYKGQQAIGI